MILEYDLRTKKLNCSDRWQQRVGYPPNITDLFPQADNVTHIHPDDIPVIRKAVSNILRSKKSDVADIRIANSEGRYIWNRIRCGAIFDSEDIPISITAIIYDIDELKSDALAMKKIYEGLKK